MFKNLKSKILIALAGLLVTPLAFAGVALAQSEGIGQVGGAICKSQVEGEGQLTLPGDTGPDSTNPQDCVTAGQGTNTAVNNLITNIVNLFSLIVGIIAVIMIVYGGFRYITSGGDTGNVTTAKNTILYALIGLVIVALAQVIVKFVLAKATDVTTT